MKPLFFKLIILMISFLPTLAYAANDQNHLDPLGIVIFWVTLIFFFGIIGRYIARYFHQSGVLGELLMGIIIGNLFYHYGLPLAVILREGPAIFDIMRDTFDGQPLILAVYKNIPDPIYAIQVLAALTGPSNIDLIKVANVIDIFSRYGVIFLLFMVGLESSVQELCHTGKESLRVAIIGVLAPMGLGFLCMYFISLHSSFNTKLFTAATLSATSVGITARVLRDLHKTRTREARTILGAAMIDDILGLIILAIVSGIILNGVVHVDKIALIVINAVLFFTLSVLFGPWLLRQAVKCFHSFDRWEAKLIVSFLFLMLLAWSATQIQLATIIGAFAAGIIIHDGFFDSRDPSKENLWTIKMLMMPLEALLSPLFFMLIGIQVKLETFMNWHVLFLAAALILAAILGKLISGYGGSRQDNRLIIGIGMLPRGEVGLVFASIGHTLGVMPDNLFSSVILMVIVTTMIAPPLLKICYAKHTGAV